MFRNATMLRKLAMCLGLAIGLAASGCQAQPETPGDGVRVERVQFSSAGEPVVGDLYLADGTSTARRGPAVVVTGAWMTVRQQMAARYAAMLADRGITALVFDYRGWGESGGARRQLEDPEAKIVDTRAALDYLASRDDIDGQRLGGLGICASSGYMVRAAAQHAGVRSLALAAPWLHDREIVLETYGGEDGVTELVAAGRAADAAYRSTGRQTFVPAASLTDATAVMFDAPYYTDAGRGMLPAWRNEADPAFWEPWLTFDGVAAAPLVEQPLLMVHSDAAAIPGGARKFYDRVTAPKDELWLDGVSQFDFYDQPEPVDTAVDAIARHFAETL